jgi:hypothetical protein
MVESADDARKRATLAAAALRLVNDAAAAPLVAAADRGETSALIAIEPVDIPATRTGRLHDAVLIDAFERASEVALARACRIFAALGFSLSAVPEVEREEDADRVTDVVRRIRITQIELGFAAADGGRGGDTQLLRAVALPPAHRWRARADSARVVQQYERKALALIAEHSERGNDSCRLAWRDLSGGPVNSEHLSRLTEALRGRGFRVELIDASSTLRVNW